MKYGNGSSTLRIDSPSSQYPQVTLHLPYSSVRYPRGAIVTIHLTQTYAIFSPVRVHVVHGRSRLSLFAPSMQRCLTVSRFTFFRLNATYIGLDWPQHQAFSQSAVCDCVQQNKQTQSWSQAGIQHQALSGFADPTSTATSIPTLDLGEDGGADDATTCPPRERAEADAGGLVAAGRIRCVTSGTRLVIFGGGSV